MRATQKNLVSSVLAIFLCFVINAQYLHPTVGIQSEYVGSCLVADCGPSSYQDDGGGANYSNGVNQIYRVFCPNTAGNCMQVTFNSFNVETGWDFLLVKNGPTQNSPDFTAAPASNTNYAGIIGLHGNLNGVTPFSYTSTDASGCLTFRFYSDGTVNRAGWNATLQCVPCAGGPNGTDNNDCQRVTPLCSSTSVSGNATGPGIAAEGCTGNACPAGGENHTNWYSFQAFTSGTLNITITPTSGTDDYDFAIYGPNVTCNALGAPLRCTDSGNTGVTGLTGTAGDFTEDVTGDSYLQTLNVNAGEHYFLVVDEWSPNAGSGYTLSFGGTASLDCIILPVELSEFEAEYVPDQDVVDVYWATETEKDNDYFLLERSTDGENFVPINRIEGSGNSSMETKYYAIDEDPFLGINYYRLKQYDINGDFNYSDVKSVNILDDAYDILSIVPNPTENTTEVIFNCYNKELADLKIFNMSGQLIEHASLNCVSGGNRVKIDLSDEQDGIYMLTLTTNNKVYTEKLVKQ